MNVARFNEFRMIDVNEPESIEIKLSSLRNNGRHVIHVNVDGICVTRITFNALQTNVEIIDEVNHRELYKSHV